MRESIYLFKQGFQPVWEDRRNINGGSWTFRVPKQNGPDFFTRVQLMAIGEKLQGCLELGKQNYYNLLVDGNYNPFAQAIGMLNIGEG